MESKIMEHLVVTNLTGHFVPVSGSAPSQNRLRDADEFMVLAVARLQALLKQHRGDGALCTDLSYVADAVIDARMCLAGCDVLEHHAASATASRMCEI